MRIFPVRISGVLICWLLLTASAFGEEGSGERFSYDPAMAGKAQPTETSEAAGPIAIESGGTEGEVRLSTKTPVAPYVEAVNGKAPSAEELRLLPDEMQRGPLDRYQLGAGIGIAVEENTSLSLGYRWHQPMSLLDDKRPATVTPRDDLRIFFDVKIPFD